MKSFLLWAQRSRPVANLKILTVEQLKQLEEALRGTDELLEYTMVVWELESRKDKDDDGSV